MSQHRGSSRGGMEEMEVISARRLEKTRAERRWVMGTLCLLAATTLAFLVAVCLARWLHIQLPRAKLNATSTVHLGIWGEWRIDQVGEGESGVWLWAN